MQTVPRSGTVVLVTEDDDNARFVYRRILEDEGYEVLEARDGAECLRMLYGRKVNLLILDLMMPKLTGWDVMHIKDNDPTIALIPTIIITGLEARAARNKPLHGASMILEKPFTPTMLIHTLAVLLSPS